MTDTLSPEPFLSSNSLTSFLPEKFRPRNYLVLILMVAFCLPFMTRGARLALQSNNNEIKDWLPDNYPESAELRKFQKHFAGEQFALISWEGCTLGNTEKLELLARKLVPSETDLKAVAENKSLAKERGEEIKAEKRLFKKVVTGPGVIAQLTSNPLNLSKEEAIKRLEGSLVGPVPEEFKGQEDADMQRVTCMIVTLSAEGQKNNKMKKQAIDLIRHVAVDECKIPAVTFHMGGPPVDNVEIDREGERTLVRLAALSGLVGFVLSYLCFRSVKLTIMVFFTGGISAGLSLAIVYYFGLFETFIMGLDRPRLGAVDAILMSMPPVVYVLGLSGAIHIVNYFSDARRDHGLRGAAEEAVRHGWLPCTLAALTTAVGLGSLFISDITPIKKFGLFTAIGVLTTLMLLFSLLPALLFRFPPKEKPRRSEDDKPQHPFLDALILRIGSFIIHRHGIVSLLCTLVMIGAGYGLSKIQTRIQLLKLFAADANIIKDYAWLEEHLGNLVPMEVVVKVAPERQRKWNEVAEKEDSQFYSMNMLERMQLIQRVQEQIEGHWESFEEGEYRVGGLSHVGRTLTAVTFGPDIDGEQSAGERMARMSTVLAKKLEDSRNRIMSDGEYLRDELPDGKYDRPSGREFWRISARVAALEDVDYGTFVHDIRAKVEPILNVYNERDLVLQKLHEQGKQLSQASILLIYHDPQELLEKKVPEKGEHVEAPLLKGALLSELLSEANARVKPVNLALVTEQLKDETYRQKFQHYVKGFDCVVVADADKPIDEGEMLSESPLLVQMSTMPVLFMPATLEANGTSDNSSIDGISASYTGIVPLVYRTQARLMVSLVESSVMSFVLIAIVMAMVLRSLPAGIAAMAPNIFPIVLVFGIMGWLGVKIDIGIMMTASVALGVAVDDTIHFLTWFRDGINHGMNNKQATLHAYQRCASAMFQTTLIGGLGLAVFAASTFTPTQQFGVLMVTLLSAALIGDLVFLPAILCGWCGRFFGGNNSGKVDPPNEMPPAQEEPQQFTATVRPAARRDSPHGSMVRMFAFLLRPFLT